MAYGQFIYGTDVYGAVFHNPTVNYTTTATLTAASTKDAGTSEGTFSMLATMVVSIVRPLPVDFNGVFTVGGTFSEIPFSVSDFSGIKSRTITINKSKRTVKTSKSDRSTST